MQLQSSNSPQQVLSRAIHGDYFRLIPIAQIIEHWSDKIIEHREKCQHPKCIHAMSIGQPLAFI